ncbi:MAG: PIN domain-containing protein [Nitrospirae bacterium]|nr:PIN domain-containing protein [Nitrospirota bacterium]
MRIYLDVCCLNRPFDDHSQDRVRIESEAVLTILSRGQSEKWIFIGSEVIEVEISKISDDDKRQKVNILYHLLKSHIVVDSGVEKRAIELENLGFESFDALHIACAEKGNANVLLTTDDKFLSNAFLRGDVLTVRVENPLRWIMEVI